MSTLRYRSDIDGLRAIAVLSVVLYHFNLAPVHGGFTGVDVFFVISGYLITKIIHREVGEGRFSFAAFYERRLRRLFPALFAVLAVSTVAAAGLLLPSDLRAFSSAAWATIGFASNVLFWRESGYFDPSSELNPLLHTWSLAVEEQFYIFYPIALLLIQRFFPLRLGLVLAVAALISFAGCVYFQANQPTATFYLIPFRAWELAVGGLLAINPPSVRINRGVRAAVGLAGLAGLFFALWWVRAGIDFPGWLAAIPVASTAALLWAGEGEGSPVSRWLAWEPLRLVGLISYSLYLWHWPVLVFTQYATGLVELSVSARLVLLLAAFVLATASYRWVEQPFRRGTNANGGRSRRRLFGTTVALTALLVAGIFGAREMADMPGRFAPQVLALDAARDPVIPFENCDGTMPDANSRSCVIGRGQPGPLTLLWGDSHAMAWAAGFASKNFTNDGPVVLALKSACPPLEGVRINFGRGCPAYTASTLDWIRLNRPDQVIMMASWTEYSRPDGFYSITDAQGDGDNRSVFPASLARTTEAILPFTHRLVIVGPTPGAPQGAPVRAAMAELHDSPWPNGITVAKAHADAAYFWKAARKLNRPRLVIVDPTTWFCDNARCNYAAHKDLLYRDQAHLSVEGARFAAYNLLPYVRGLKTVPRAND